MNVSYPVKSENVYLQVNITVLTLKWFQRTACKANQLNRILTTSAWIWVKLQCTGWRLVADAGVLRMGRGAQPFCHSVSRVGLDLWDIMVMGTSDQETDKNLWLWINIYIYIYAFIKLWEKLKHASLKKLFCSSKYWFNQNHQMEQSLISSWLLVYTNSLLLPTNSLRPGSCLQFLCWYLATVWTQARI